ncbi:hypothetical protein [Aquipuribacter sp. MA13-6]|uniref:hypothetical protein n=1 Tax=unclassified Aquipuribacter TaxID=2635084 RepID=UPI003EEFEC17
MDVVDWLRSLRNRWVVSTVMVLVTAGCVFGVSLLVLPRYEASASLLLLGPNSYVDQQGDDIRVNPYARFGGAGEGVTGTTLIAVLMSPQVMREAVADGFPGEYELAFNPSGGGAIIDITVTADSPEESLRGVEMMVATAQETLMTQQTEAGAPEESLVNASLLTQSEEAESLDGAKIRAMGVTAVFGLALTLLLTRGLDVRKQRRLARRVGAGPTGRSGAEPLAASVPRAAPVEPSPGPAPEVGVAEGRPPVETGPTVPRLWWDDDELRETAVERRRAAAPRQGASGERLLRERRSSARGGESRSGTVVREAVDGPRGSTPDQ